MVVRRAQCPPTSRVDEYVWLQTFHAEETMQDAEKLNDVRRYFFVLQGLLAMSMRARRARHSKGRYRLQWAMRIAILGLRCDYFGLVPVAIHEGRPRAAGTKVATDTEVSTRQSAHQTFSRMTRESHSHARQTTL